MKRFFILGIMVLGVQMVSAQVVKGKTGNAPVVTPVRKTAMPMGRRDILTQQMERNSTTKEPKSCHDEKAQLHHVENSAMFLDRTGKKDEESVHQQPVTGRVNREVLTGGDNK